MSPLEYQHKHPRGDEDTNRITRLGPIVVRGSWVGWRDSWVGSGGRDDIDQRTAVDSCRVMGGWCGADTASLLRSKSLSAQSSPGQVLDGCWIWVQTSWETGISSGAAKISTKNTL